MPSKITFTVQDLNIGYPYGQPIAPWNGGNSPNASCYTEDILSYLATYGSVDIINYGFSTEPQIAVNPKNKNNVVAIWQINRTSYYGCQEAGIGYSLDGGRTWQRSLIPTNRCLGGIIDRVDDVWVDFTSEGRAVASFLISNTSKNPNTYYQSGVASTYSDDGGATWSTPVPVASSPLYQNDPNQDIHSDLQCDIPPFTGPCDCIQCPIPGPTPPGCTFPPCNPNPYGFNPAISGFYDDKDMVLHDPNDPRFVYVIWHRYPTSSFSPYHSDSVMTISVDGGVTFGNIGLVYDPFPDLFEQGLSNGLYWNCYMQIDQLAVLPRANKCNKKHRKDKFPNKKERFSGDVIDIARRTYALPGATSQQFESDSFPTQYTGQNLVLIRSHNKGRTWTKHAPIVVEYPETPIYSGGYTYDASGNITGTCGVPLRSGDTHDFKVNLENGFCYLVYFNRSPFPNQLPTVFIKTSRDGGYTWSKSVIVSTNTLNAKNPQAFCPTVAIGKNGRVGVTFHDTRFDPYQVSTPGNPQPCTPSPTTTLGDAWFVLYREVSDPNGGSTGIGLDFVEEVRVTKTSYNLQQGANTYSGTMVQGEYNGLRALDKTFYFLYIKSVSPLNAPYPSTVEIIYGPDSAGNQLDLVDNGKLTTSPFVSIIQT
jgi:hypothetical protein